MADNSYNLEIKLASKNGYFTPQESRNYYGRYDRSGYCVHWWGDGTDENNHNNIVNYIYNQSVLGNKSVNYVLSDAKITMMVNPDNVAWCQQSGNATEVSVETEPQLSAEGYKKHGWLKDQLDGRYGRKLVIHGHNFWFATACPGTISLDRIAQEADKWARGVYEPVPTPPTPPPVPTPPPAPDVVVTPITQVKRYTLANAKLVNIKDMSVVKTFPIDTPIDIGGKSSYNGKEFQLSVYATTNNTKQGFLVGDLKDQAGDPTPPATPPPVPVPPASPEWVQNLRDIDDTKYWAVEETPLIDITTGKPTGTKVFAKDEEFVGSALTKVGSTEYRITEYSFAKKIYNGVPISKLTLTPPGVPNIPPVPDHPVDKVWLVAALEAIIAAIRAIIDKVKGA